MVVGRRIGPPQDVHTRKSHPRSFIYARTSSSTVISGVSCNSPNGLLMYLINGKGLIKIVLLEPDFFGKKCSGCCNNTGHEIKILFFHLIDAGCSLDIPPNMKNSNTGSNGPDHGCYCFDADTESLIQSCMDLRDGKWTYAYEHWEQFFANARFVSWEVRLQACFDLLFNLPRWEHTLYKSLFAYIVIAFILWKNWLLSKKTRLKSLFYQWVGYRGVLLLIVFMCHNVWNCANYDIPRT